jgi:carbamoyl-phosphate synthase small subunit
MNLATKNAVLIMADGSYFIGSGAGNKAIVFGEICFNTATTGYQEILSDPSYLGQIITFTFPHIGNVGVNLQDIESLKPRAHGLIMRQAITNPSNYRSESNLNDWLIANKLTAITGLDTRKITQLIRKKGAKNVAIIFDDKITDPKFLATKIAEITKELSKKGDLSGVELAALASQNKDYQWQNEGIWNQNNNCYNQVTNKKFKVVAIDYGAKLNILHCLADNGCDVTVLGAKATFAEIKSHNPDGVFLSNGPGDPAETGKYSTKVILEILENNIPLFGICLGHQLLAIAIGAKTSKMAYGHRGANHPVLNLLTKKVEITSQNHGFSVDKNTLPESAEITHISLFDQSIEGIRLKNKKAFSVQYHPESSPGPIDSRYLFAEFISLMKRL